MKRRDRKNKVRRLYLREGLEAPEIAEQLLDDGDLKGRADSVARLVRRDVAEIKAEIEAAQENQAVEDSKAQTTAGVPGSLARKFERLRHAWKMAVEIVDDDSTITTTWSNENGSGTSTRPKWSATAKQAAVGEMRKLAKELATIEEQIEEYRNARDESGRDEGLDGRLVIVESDLTIDELIKRNSLN